MLTLIGVLNVRNIPFLEVSRRGVERPPWRRSPRPFPLLVELGSWEEKRLRVESEVSDERAQPLGINVRVARRCCDALMA